MLAWTGLWVEAVLRGGVDWLARVEVVQPVLWAVGVALTAWWVSFGVVPAAVVCLSLGEVVAAVVAGALSVEDGARVVAARSWAVVDLGVDGGMLSGGAPGADVVRGWEPAGGGARVGGAVGGVCCGGVAVEGLVGGGGGVGRGRLVGAGGGGAAGAVGG
ncbi:acyltransferase domain-containing protein, partial [Streptomyces sp. BE20]|uniref:acyltransferase domain-containing protein n=1 Tax=Streptomyces sp. BE20 TaxID=3002525 RepID=UPI002E7A5F1A